MIKKIIFIVEVMFFLLPCIVLADSNIDTIEVKYFKTIIYNYGFSDTKSLMYNPLEKNFSFTQEITAEEYNLMTPSLGEISLNGSGYTETNYKKMTTTILKNGTKYKYQVLLNWKLIPATRSYDIIGIGHYKSVKLSGSADFLLTYNSTTSKTADIFTSSTGTTATFKIPSGNISSLSAKLSFNVEKNVNATILKQIAVGDYAHSTTKIDLAAAKKHSVGSTGIIHENSVINYFDNMSGATATWTGNW